MEKGRGLALVRRQHRLAVVDERTRDGQEFFVDLKLECTFVTSRYRS